MCMLQWRPRRDRKRRGVVDSIDQQDGYETPVLDGRRMVLVMVLMIFILRASSGSGSSFGIVGMVDLCAMLESRLRGWNPRKLLSTPEVARTWHGKMSRQLLDVRD